MITPFASLNENAGDYPHAAIALDDHEPSRKSSSNLNRPSLRPVFVEVVTSSAAPRITTTHSQRISTSSAPPNSAGRSTLSSSEGFIRASSGGSSCKGDRLTTTDLLRANEALRRENERLRLRLLRAQASDAGGSAANSDPPDLSVPPSSSPPSVRSTADRDRRLRSGHGGVTLPPPPSRRRSTASPANPATPAIPRSSPPPQSAPPPPRSAVPRSPFVGFFRHCARPGGPGAGNLSQLRFREWVGHAPSLF